MHDRYPVPFCAAGGARTVQQARAMTGGRSETPVSSVSAGAISADRRHPDAGPGPWITDTEPSSVDTRKLRSRRLAPLRDLTREKEYTALLLSDPNKHTS